MDRRFYSKRHFDRLSNGGPDTADRVAERIRYRECADKAHAEMLTEFSPLTPENAGEAIAWQTQRIRELIDGA